MGLPDRFLDVILKLTGQNSCEDTIFVPSGRLANFSFSSWFSLGPNAKLFTKITLSRIYTELSSISGSSVGENEV